MNIADRTIAEPVTTFISLRATTAQRLRVYQLAIGAPNYDAALCELLGAGRASFRELRERLGLSQRQLAEHAGVSQATISRLERGEISDQEPVSVRVRVTLRELGPGATA